MWDMIKTTVKGADKAAAALRKAIEGFVTEKAVTIGIHEDETARNDPDSGITNASLGAVHEFGSDAVNIPARPWLYPGVASGNVEYLKIIEQGLKDGDTLEEILQTIGVVAVSKAQQYITELKTPANAASTITRKGSSNPLIDTGVLRSSINMKIVEKMPQEDL